MTRLNEFIESLSRNRKEATHSATRSVLIHQKFSEKSHLGKKISNVSFCSQYFFVSIQYKNISGIKETFILHTHSE